VSRKVQESDERRLIEPEVASDLLSVQTATISYQLRRRGVEGTFLGGLGATRPDLPMLGVARTLRYVAFRADVFEQCGGGMNAQKRVIDDIHPGEILVIEARGELGAGTIGDILALRLQRRGGVGVVTDGAVRDMGAIRAMDLPVYCAGAHAAVLGERHVPMDTDLPITCAGVLVMPGDVLRGDEDGVIVIPRALAADVGRSSVAQEQEERFIADRVAEGEPIDGLYPLGDKWREEFEQWKGDAK
jgi:5-oxopent-3-ene-1,2,5-tricarboxylate decarboxylase/2-hydroxyhepta-2,4-diene-1,7-dioate isomerase